MRIEITDYVAGAQAACGLAVIIDVFRAFSVAAYAFAGGARSVVPVALIEDARALKSLHPDWLLIGERHARALPGFDCGNSPSELERLDVRDRTLIHTTHSGTQGLAAALQAEEIITGALVNAGAITRYIRARRPELVTLVRMGHEARERCDEDDLCARLLAERLAGKPPYVGSAAEVRERLRNAESAAKFFDPACHWVPPRDFELCTELDAFEFIMRLERTDGGAVLRRIDVMTTGEA